MLRLRADVMWANAGAPVSASTTDVYFAMLNQAPTTAAVAHAFPGASRLTAGAHDKSLVWILSHLRGNYQMPPLVSHVVDDVGTQRLADWIDAIAP